MTAVLLESFKRSRSGQKTSTARSALDVPQVASPGWTLQGADLPDDNPKRVDVRLARHLACRSEHRGSHAPFLP